MSAIEGGLRDAYAKRFEQGATNKAALAAKIGCDRSLITRRLNGGENMTIKTIADLAWGLGHCIEVAIIDAGENRSRNDLVFDANNVPPAKPSSIAVISGGDWNKAIAVTKLGAAQSRQLVST